MPRYQYKNTDIKINMPPPEANNPTVLSPEKSNLAKAQNKNFKTEIMKLFKDLKEDINKCINKNTNS